MTQRDRDLDEILRRALHTAAGSVEPADDGLDRIRARLTTPRPLPVAWVMAVCAAVARRVAGARPAVSGWWQSLPGVRRGPAPGHARPSPWRLRPAAVLAMAAFVVAAGVIALTPLPQQAMSQTASLIHSLSGGRPSVPGAAVGGGVNGQGSGLAAGGGSQPGAAPSGPGSQSSAASACATPPPAALAPVPCPSPSASASGTACPTSAAAPASSPGATPSTTPSGSAAPVGCPGTPASSPPATTPSPTPTSPGPTTSPPVTPSPTVSPSPASPSPATSGTSSAAPGGTAGQDPPRQHPVRRLTSAAPRWCSVWVLIRSGSPRPTARRGRRPRSGRRGLVHVAPVLEGALQHRLGHALEQVADDVADQPLPGGVVEHLADHGAGLAPVVVLARAGCRRHAPCRRRCASSPAGGARCRRCGPPLEFGAYTGSETLRNRIAPSLL